MAYVLAKDCKCHVCGAPAVAFWPVIDPDIPARPWCRKCLDKAKIELLEQLDLIHKPKKKISNENV